MIALPKGGADVRALVEGSPYPSSPYPSSPYPSGPYPSGPCPSSPCPSSAWTFASTHWSLDLPAVDLPAVGHPFGPGFRTTMRSVGADVHKYRCARSIHARAVRRMVGFDRGYDIFGTNRCVIQNFSYLCTRFRPARTGGGNGASRRFFEKSGKVENLSDFICAVNFLCLLLQSKTAGLPM